MTKLGVAVIGFGWMGQVHSRAYQRLAHHYPELDVVISPVVVSDSEPTRLADATNRFGFTSWVTDWRDILTDDRVDAVSVTAPNFLHREIGTAVARAGKHLWIEKPVGLSVDDAQSVADAVAEAGVQSAVGFNYRNAPAVEYARDLITSGALGDVTNARVRLLTDYAAHPHGSLSWRFERALGGNGVLGDLASHGVDLIRYLMGEIDSVVADTSIVIDQRPRPSGAGSHYDISSDGELGPVENEDYLSCLMRLRSGARTTLEASRISVGDQCNYGFEIHATAGSVSWDFRRIGELQVCRGENYLNQTTSTVFVGPGHGDYTAFQPGAAVALSYDDLKVIEAAHFVQSIVRDQPVGATVGDALASARTLAAIEASAASSAWVTLDA